MSCNRIDISFAKCCKHIFRCRKAVHLLYFRQCRVDSMKKEFSCSCRILYSNILPEKIIECLNITVRSNCDHLTAVQIRSRPLIIVFPVIHRIAAPDTVYRTVCKAGVFFTPRNKLKIWFIPKFMKYFRCNLNVNAGIISVHVKIGIRLKFINDHCYLLQTAIRLLLLLVTAAAYDAYHKDENSK